MRRSKFAIQEDGRLDEAVQLADAHEGPDEQLEQKRVQHALESAIRALAPEYREVLVLRDVEGLTAAEVAEVLGSSVGAVKSRLHRARVLVREAVSALISAPEAPASDTCPDVVSLFSQHLEREISPEACAEMERHVESCERCRRACDSLKHTLWLCKTSPAVEVPVSVQEAVRVAIQGFLSKR
jgi:RNA polymerase sigma-70 factor (ECF subfamily)